MRTIELTKGRVAIVNDEDYDTIAAHKWYWNDSSAIGYASRIEITDGKRILVRMHRFLMGAKSGESIVDHIDGNSLNNQRNNLRFVTKQQNCVNRGKYQGVSQYMGVIRIKEGLKPWRARIRVGDKLHNLGAFKEEYEAALAYNMAARKAPDFNYRRLNKITCPIHC